MDTSAGILDGIYDCTIFHLLQEEENQVYVQIDGGYGFEYGCVDWSRIQQLDIIPFGHE